MEEKINIETKAVHAGDRKKAGPQIPSTTPINLASSYFYESMAQLDRVFGQEEAGFSYARYDNPTNVAFGGKTFDQLFAANLGRWHITRIDLKQRGAPLACHRR